MLNLFAHELQENFEGQLTPEIIFEAATHLFEKSSGGYAVVSMILNEGLVAMRDPNGIRPLILGKREVGQGTEYMIASESVALDIADFEIMRDVKPGEVIFITKEGEFFSKQCIKPKSYTPCMFEFVYFARPDSVIDGMSVYKSRLRMGEYLAQRIIKEGLHHDGDVVMPIPDTSRSTALQVAHHLGVKYREGFIKNRYIG